MNSTVKEIAGGKWWKVDFHVHTPASMDYGKGSREPEKEKQVTPKEFLLKAIDQPEDDLDTKNITDFIVKGINEKKQSQQIIVVTHNPNIVVNTNSEQVIHMEFAGGEINASHSGALQDVEIRDAICDVMEGGREALESRYYRITKALE